MAPRQYLGSIVSLETGNLIPSFPTLFLQEDPSGGYNRFLCKLRLRNMKFNCISVRSHSPERLFSLKQDLADTCTHQGIFKLYKRCIILGLFLGVPVNPMMILPLTFTEAVHEMITIGLL